MSSAQSHPLDDEIASGTATEQAQLLESRQISSEELVTSCLARIDAYDRELGAFVTVRSREALAEARAIDHQRKVASSHGTPFLGVPVSIADLVATAGTRTTYSSTALSQYVPTEDAAAARRLKAAGFILIGKTNVSEFGLFSTTESTLNGVCRNPWNLHRTAGGPCGGAAAAVAAGLCSVSHAVNGGGSARTSASCCGLVAFTPSTAAAHALAPTADGIIARTVDGATAVAHVLADPDQLPRTVTEDRIPLRVALSTVNPFSWPLEPECVAAVREAGQLLADCGHDVDEVAFDVAFDVYDELMRVRASVPSQYPGVSAEPSDPTIRAVVDGARREPALPARGRSSLTLKQCAHDILDQWRGFDLLLTATALRPPVAVGWQFHGADVATPAVREELLVPLLTLLANAGGQPALTVPLQWTTDGLPIGVQLIGRHGSDGVVLGAGKQLERARPDSQWRNPPLGPNIEHAAEPHEVQMCA